ncbi:hypothetical protein MmiEs2_05160 [Methanimicrococcus stummii]|uniref:Uncharacterized protein n=1 Tax=Methanimicrococcus stummii TaxID=3028294 RepID=A0AA96V9G5_9EURY|nr:hypothetical protein [Methanimicrococcus sp. Es2]WNY28331.1 hypothetical protein MmiEs2_05160 [Methanimicrococcus sp. Es2]
MPDHKLISEINTTFTTSILKYHDEDLDICLALKIPENHEFIKFYDEAGNETDDEKNAVVKEYQSENITVTRNLKTKDIQIKAIPEPYDNDLFRKLFIVKSYYGNPYELSEVKFIENYNISGSSDILKKFFENEVLVYEYIQKRYRYLPNDVKELAFEINDGKLEIKIKTKNQNSLTELIDLLLENKIILQH